MPVNEQKFDAEQDRVRQLAESYEGNEKKEVVDLYVDRIGKIKTAIMDSQLNDAQKEDYLKRLDSYLKLVDANNLERLRKQYEPLLHSMEITLGPEVKEQAQDDREAKLEDVADLEIRKNLLKDWREATKFKEKFDSKKQQIDLLIKAKNLQVEGTELQVPTTSALFYTDFIDSKLREYYETKDVGQKRQKLKDVIEQSDLFYEVLTVTEKRLKTVNSQSDLEKIDLNDRNVLAEQTMFIKRKRYEEAKKDFTKKMDEMKIPKEDPIRQHMEGMVFTAADDQFETLKQNVLLSSDPATRTVFAEQANQYLDQAVSEIEGANKYLSAVDVKDMVDRGYSAAKIFEQSPLLKRFAYAVPVFLMPQFAVGLGYYESVKRGDTSESKVLEGADFGISLVPIVGGLWDIGFAINGTTISGRKMGTGERWVRGVIGAGSVVLDAFTFGLGGSLVKAGGKAAVEATIKLTAQATAKKMLAEVVVKDLAEKGGEAALREAAEVVGKETAEVTGKEAAEAVGKEAGQMTAVLGKEEQQIVFKGLQKGATAAERSAMREVMQKALMEKMEPLIAKVQQEAARITAQEAEKIVSKTVDIATRRTAGLAGFANRFASRATAGAYKAGGIDSLEKMIIASTARDTAVKTALEAGKQVGGTQYYVKAAFVKEGEILWGDMGKSVGTNAAKALWHLHNPVEVLKMFQSPVKSLARLVHLAPRNVFEDKAVVERIEQEMKANLMTDGKNAKEVEQLFADVKQKSWKDFMKENENNPILKDPDVVEFFKSFQEQFPKSGEQGKALTDIYKSFKEFEPSAFVSGKMAWDSRKMEWPAFLTKYKDNLREATPQQLKAMEEQFAHLHSLDLELPVNVARIQTAKEGVKLGKIEVEKLTGEFRALEAEKAEIEASVETVGEQYAKELAAKEKANGGKSLSEKEKTEIWYGIYEKLPEGPFKRSVDEFRDTILKEGKVDAKAASPEFKMYSGRAMDSRAVTERLVEIDKNLAAKKEELEAAGVNVKEHESVASPLTSKKLSQKESADEVAKSKMEETAAIVSKDYQRSIKKIEQELAFLSKEKQNIDVVVTRYEQLLANKQRELGTELLSQKQEAEIWFQVYQGLPKGTLKSEIDAIRKKALGFPKEGTTEFKEKMGEIAKKRVVERKGELDTKIQENKDQAEKLRAG